MHLYCILRTSVMSDNDGENCNILPQKHHYTYVEVLFRIGLVIAAAYLHFIRIYTSFVSRGNIMNYEAMTCQRLCGVDIIVVNKEKTNFLF